MKEQWKAKENKCKTIKCKKTTEITDQRKIKES